jgi:hypothetical protein
VLIINGLRIRKNEEAEAAKISEEGEENEEEEEAQPPPPLRGVWSRHIVTTPVNIGDFWCPSRHKSRHKASHEASQTPGRAAIFDF